MTGNWQDRTPHMTLETLNETFGSSKRVEFLRGDHGAEMVRLTNRHGCMEVALQGAQLLHWQPTDQRPVIWLSPQARFTEGKSLRGGAPICWPWFGPHAKDASLPAHGFARNHRWLVTEVCRIERGTRLSMFYEPPREMQRSWPHKAHLVLEITLAETLKIALTTHNVGHNPIYFTQAVHTYFQVGDIARARVAGLHGKSYIDKVGEETMRSQAGDLRVAEEVDRIYLDTTGELEIIDEALERRIRISRQGSGSCVVWNPWIDKSERLGDLGPEGYRQMLCVETTNAASDEVMVNPGEHFTQVSRYRVEPLTTVAAR